LMTDTDDRPGATGGQRIEIAISAHVLGA